MNDRKRFEPNNATEWHTWLTKNHQTEEAIWLIYRKKSHPQPNLTYTEALDEALCFGWIDSLTRRIDDERAEQYFARRKAKSVWSQINKKKVEALVASGRMHPSGLSVIESAKANGSWAILDEASSAVLPPDVESVLSANPAKRSLFDALSPSARRIALERIVTAKKPETRKKRIAAMLDQIASPLQKKVTSVKRKRSAKSEEEA